MACHVLRQQHTRCAKRLLRGPLSGRPDFAASLVKAPGFSTGKPSLPHFSQSDTAQAGSQLRPGLGAGFYAPPIRAGFCATGRRGRREHMVQPGLGFTPHSRRDFPVRKANAASCRRLTVRTARGTHGRRCPTSGALSGAGALAQQVRLLPETPASHRVLPPVSATPFPTQLPASAPGRWRLKNLGPCYP